MHYMEPISMVLLCSLLCNNGDIVTNSFSNVSKDVYVVLVD